MASEIRVPHVEQPEHPTKHSALTYVSWTNPDGERPQFIIDWSKMPGPPLFLFGVPEKSNDH